jgi:hypothetical protein
MSKQPKSNPRPTFKDHGEPGTRALCNLCALQYRPAGDSAPFECTDQDAVITPDKCTSFLLLDPEELGYRLGEIFCAIDILTDIIMAILDHVEVLPEIEP